MDNTIIWELDPVHSSVQFSVRHLGIANIRGEFTGVGGRLSENVEDGRKIEVTIQTASISTHNEMRDGHLKSAEFFDAEQFPAMTFHSKAVENAGSGNLKVAGDFTLRGVSKEIVLEVKGPSPETTDPLSGKTKIGAFAQATINRKDFGLNLPAPMENGGLLLDENVLITIEAEFIKQ